MKYEKIDSALFIQNRKDFVENLKPNSIAIFHSNDEMLKNGDNFFPFRQNSDLFYLTGIDQEKTILLLYPDCYKKEWREILFIRRTEERLIIWEGHKYTIEEATDTSGISTVMWTEDFWSVTQEIFTRAENIYVNWNDNIRNSSEVESRDERWFKQLRAKYPLHKVERCGPIMDKIRSIKKPIEIELMQHACNITEKAFRRVLQFTKPGVGEYEIEAEITHEFLRNKATGHAYGAIIASGGDSCILHYHSNNKIVKDGDIILMDFGCEYANYASDLSRTIPANGKFSPRQKAVYNAVLRTLNFAKSMLVEGTLYDEYHKEVCKFIESEMIDLKLFTRDDVNRQDPKNPLFFKYFMHGTSHFMGLDVHDVGNRALPMKAGMVFSCEPGIYIREENIGIRLENDILITQGEPVDLMKNIPIDADEIEDLMNSK